MLKIILLCVIGAIVYLAIGTIVTVEHFERMGMRDSVLILVWPIMYLALVIAWLVDCVNTALSSLLDIAHKIKDRRRKK